MEQNQNPQPPVFNKPQGQQPEQPYQARVMARPMMEPVEAVKTCFKKFSDFKGRARRSEYWWFMLFTLVVWWVISFLGTMTPVFTYIGLILVLLLSIPQFAALTRRLHDSNHSGWWVFAMFVCFLVFYGSFAVMLAPHMSALMGEGDNMAITLAVHPSPQAMSVAAVAGFCYFILFIITLVFAVMDSHWTENKYGPSPKYQ